jgi:hypothetical protein
VARQEGVARQRRAEEGLRRRAEELRRELGITDRGMRALDDEAVKAFEDLHHSFNSRT